MASRATSAFALICASLALAPVAWGGEAAKDGGPAAQARDVRGWLMRIHDAASRRNFQGTFVVSGGGNVASARMSHFCEGANQYERIESLDGKARNVFRHNDVVHTVWPASRVAVVEQRDLLTSFPALLQAGADTVGDWYELAPAGRRAGCRPRGECAARAREGRLPLRLPALVRQGLRPAASSRGR